MNINSTLFGLLFSILVLVVIIFTLRFAKRAGANNMALVFFYSLLLNFLLPPAAWLYCWYWSRKVGS